MTALQYVLAVLFTVATIATLPYYITMRRVYRRLKLDHSAVWQELGNPTPYGGKFSSWRDRVRFTKWWKESRYLTLGDDQLNQFVKSAMMARKVLTILYVGMFTAAFLILISRST